MELFYINIAINLTACLICGYVSLQNKQINKNDKIWKYKSKNGKI